MAARVVLFVRLSRDNSSSSPASSPVHSGGFLVPMVRRLNCAALFILFSVAWPCHAGTHSAVDVASGLSRRTIPREVSTEAASSLQAALPLLQDGDLIFITTHGPIFRHVSETTGSWETHVGILFHDERKGWLVAESILPVSKFTPLEKFVSRSTHHRFLVSRLRNELTAEDRPDLVHVRASRARAASCVVMARNTSSKRPGSA